MKTEVKAVIKYYWDEMKMEIDIAEMFAVMDDDGRAEFIAEMGLEHTLAKYLLKEVKQGYAGPSFNSHYHNLREKILLDAGGVLREFTRAILRELDIAKHAARRYRDAYYHAHHNVCYGCKTNPDPWELLKVQPSVHQSEKAASRIVERVMAIVEKLEAEGDEDKQN